MKFTFAHNNINICDMEKSVAFYEKALGFKITREHMAGDGSFRLVFMTDGETNHSLELTWLRDKEGKYDLGDNEIHLAVRTDDYEAAHALHSEMGCICYENEAMKLYFIEDPDGYWTEILKQ